MRMKLLAPIGILAGAGLLVYGIHATREEIVPRPRLIAAPLVRTVLAEPVDFQFRVKAHGNVVPRRESDLVPQVSGEVVWVSPDLVAGGFVEAGQVLVRIDTADYEVALESARANVARAESEFARAKKENERQKRLVDRSVASQARIDDAENAFRIARASLRERRAQLERAERDLLRTELTAPYQGRVRSERVDLGQFASRGTPLADLYAVDFAEVRLPLPDREFAFLDLALTSRAGGDGQPDSEASADGPAVRLRAEFGGREHYWNGHIVRTEGELDPKSRMVQVVARVEDPYGNVTADRPPLAVGFFVEAEIEGRTVSDVYVLPRSALRRERGEERTHVLVVDAESRLRFRDVKVLRRERGRVIVGSGLDPGDRVCISRLRAVTDGMRVRVADAPSGTPELAGAGS